jgi:threonine/homoserine/homoserine lactone efflux protein
MAELAAFFGVSALVIVTPGQDTALTIRNALLGGRVGGVFTAIGVSAGQATWTVATSAGVGALLVASEPAFLALKLAGSAYLVLLGAQSFWGAFRGAGGNGLIVADADGDGVRLPPRAALRQGVLSNLGNPKMLAFFSSMLPQFASSFSGLLVLGLVFSTMTLTWLVAYSFAVARARALLRRRSVRRIIEGLTGMVLIALGLRLAMEAG